MYLQQSKNQAGRIYLSFVQGYRKDGKVKHKTVEKIGYLDDLEKIYDDPIAHFKKLALERNASGNDAGKRAEISLSDKLAPESSARKSGMLSPRRFMKLLGYMIFFSTNRGL